MDKNKKKTVEKENFLNILYFKNKNGLKEKKN